MIDPKAWYSMREAFGLVKEDIGFSDIKTFKGMIDQGMIKANKMGSNDTGARYKIKGEWLIMFMAKWEAGDFN